MVASRHARAQSSSPRAQAVDARAANRGSRDPAFEGYMRQLKQRRLESQKSRSKEMSLGEESFWARVDANLSSAKEPMPASDKKSSEASTSRVEPPKSKAATKEVATPKREAPGSWSGLGQMLDAAQKQAKAQPVPKGRPPNKPLKGAPKGPKMANKVREGTKVAKAEEWMPPRLLPKPQMKMPAVPETPQTPAHPVPMQPSCVVDDVPQEAVPEELPAEDFVEEVPELIVLEGSTRVSSAPNLVPPTPAAADVEATLRELVKLAEVVEAAKDLDDEYQVSREVEKEDEKDEGMEEPHDENGEDEAEGEVGEEESPVDDEILSDGGVMDERPAWHKGANLDVKDIPFLS